MKAGATIAVAKRELFEMARAKPVLLLLAFYGLLMVAYGIVDYGEYTLLQEPPSNVFLPQNGSLLNIFQAVYTFGSLFALAFSFDAISRERQANSITLLASQPVSRASVLTGKLLSRAALYLPVASVLPASIVAVSLALNGALTSDFQARLALVWLLTFLFLLFWLTLGVFISSLTSKPGSSLAVSVLAWLLFQRYFLGLMFSTFSLRLFWPNVGFSDAFGIPGFVNANNIFGSLFPPYHYLHALFGNMSGTGLITAPFRYFQYGINYVLNTSTTAYGWISFAWPDFAFLAASSVVAMGLTYVLYRSRDIP